MGQELEPKDWAAMASAAADSKAAEKLADATKDFVGIGQNLLDYIVGPKRVRAIGEARVAVKLAEGNAILELQEKQKELKKRTSSRLLNSEMRNQQNIEAITVEAYKALPADDNLVSNHPPSEDFVNLFFEECKGIGNEQMQQLWGKLLGGEVANPGSFHIKTLRVLKDMQPDDAILFSKICSYVWKFGEIEPVIFNCDDEIYRENEISFDALRHLENLGLVNFNAITTYSRTPPNPSGDNTISYFNRPAVIKAKASSNEINCGQVLFTEAGRQLAKISGAPSILNFYEYVCDKLIMEGNNVTRFPTPPAI